MKQSFAWWGFARGGIEPAELLSVAARIGYKGVDFLPEEHWGRAQELGLTVSAIGGHGTLTDGLNRRENHERIEGEIRVQLEKATEHGIPNLVVFTGNRNGLTDEEGAEITAEGLRRVAPLAEAAGVTLTLELLNSKKDHPDYQADHTRFGAQVCQQVNSPRVKLLYDIYHMQIMEGDVIATIRANIAHIGHFHTAGVPGRKDLDDQQELYYPAIARAIAETGYTGFIAHELSPKGDPIACLEASYRACSVAT